MKKILVWGTGKIADILCENGINGSLAGFIQTNKDKEVYNDRQVYGIDETWPEYDYMIVANSYSDEIYAACIERKINMDRFIFIYPLKKNVGEREPDVLKDILKEKNYTRYCVLNGKYEKTFFSEDLIEYQKKNTRENFQIDVNNLWPIISNKYEGAGNVSNYFWQDLWAAKLINKSGVKKHFDIGSRIDGFIAHLLAMNVEVTLIDIRELPVEIEGLHMVVDDATMLKNVSDESIESMSALCSLEHFGLGRYGDPIDPEACFTCFKEIQKKIKPRGNLYLSLPVGRERVEFNAHRIFYAQTILESFSQMQMVEFSCAAEGKIEYHVDIHKYDQDCHDGEYRYGLFHFVK